MVFRLALTFSFILSTTVSATSARSASIELARQIESRLNSAIILGNWIQKPTPKKYSDVFKMVEPFMNAEILADLKMRGRSVMNKPFPKFHYTHGDRTSKLDFFDGKVTQTINILQNDPIDVFEINGYRISHQEMLTTKHWPKKMEMIFNKQASDSALFDFIFPRAYASDSNSILGPLIIGGAILGAGFFLGKGLSKGMSNFGSKVPTTYTVDVNPNIPTNFSANLNVPTIDSIVGDLNTKFPTLPTLPKVVNVKVPADLLPASLPFAGNPYWDSSTRGRFVSPRPVSGGSSGVGAR